jgi:hypothetical protein
VQVDSRNGNIAIVDTQYFRDIVPSNLESRRRKRESINPEEIRRASLFDKSPEKDVPRNAPVKEDVLNSRTSTKRKFNTSEFAESTTPAPEDFTFVRKSGTSRSQRQSSTVTGNSTARKTLEEISTSRGKPRDRTKEDASRRDLPGRKALAPSKC